MAIFHLSVKPVQRSAGRSATAAAAYRAAEKIHDERTDTTHDYVRKRGVTHAEIVAPDGESVPSRAELWNAAEAAERRRDGTVAREIEVSLPSELSAVQRRGLALAFGRSLVAAYGCCADVCIHAPGREGDNRNAHAHILLTTRRYKQGRLTAKTGMEMSDRDRKKHGLRSRRDDLRSLRASWASMANEALERAGRPERIDARSFEAQGSDLVPMIHQGPSATAIARRGGDSERVAYNEAVRAHNAAARELAVWEEAANRPARQAKRNAADWQRWHDALVAEALAASQRQAQKEQDRETPDLSPGGRGR